MLELCRTTLCENWRRGGRLQGRGGRGQRTDRLCHRCHQQQRRRQGYPLAAPDGNAVALAGRRWQWRWLLEGVGNIIENINLQHVLNKNSLTLSESPTSNPTPSPTTPSPTTMRPTSCPMALLASNPTTSNPTPSQTTLLPMTVRHTLRLTAPPRGGNCNDPCAKGQS
jgi:hypothetical protein